MPGGSRTFSNKFYRYHNGTAAGRKAGQADFSLRKAAFEKNRDDVLSRRGMRSNGPLYGVCLGILALLAATWLAHEFDKAGVEAQAIEASAAN